MKKTIFTTFVFLLISLSIFSQTKSYYVLYVNGEVKIKGTETKLAKGDTFKEGVELVCVTNTSNITVIRNDGKKFTFQAEKTKQSTEIEYLAKNIMPFNQSTYTRAGVENTTQNYVIFYNYNYAHPDIKKYPRTKKSAFFVCYYIDNKYFKKKLDFFNDSLEICKTCISYENEEIRTTNYDLYYFKSKRDSCIVDEIKINFFNSKYIISEYEKIASFYNFTDKNQIKEMVENLVFLNYGQFKQNEFDIWFDTEYKFR